FFKIWIKRLLCVEVFLFLKQKMRFAPLVVLFFSHTFLFAQNDGVQTQNLADTFYRLENYAAALSCYTEAKNIFKQNQDWENAFKCAYNEADCLYESGESKQSIALLNQEIRFFKKQNFAPFEI